MESRSPLSEHAKPGSEQHRRFYATIAKRAYSANSDAPLPEGYVIDLNHTNRNRVLAVNSSNKHAVLAYRGTDLVDRKKAPADLGQDVLLALGLQSAGSRFKNGVRAAKAVKAAYPDYKVDLTGHSLGASTAAYVHSRVKDTGFVGFAEHVPLGEVQKEMTKNVIDRLVNPRKSDSVSYLVAGDPISWSKAASFHKNTFYVPQTARSAHSLENYLH